MRVVCEIDVDSADTPVNAALEAFRSIRRPRTTATVFDVHVEHQEPTRVDLLELFGDIGRIPGDPLAGGPLPYLLVINTGIPALLGPYRSDDARQRARAVLRRGAFKCGVFYTLAASATEIMLMPTVD